MSAKLFDKERIAKRYKDEITNLGVREYINTEGSIWIDSLLPFNLMIPEDRLGGIALTRTSILYPQHYVSWKFNAPATPLVLKDAGGKTVGSSQVPPHEAPVDLKPRWADIIITVPDGTDLSSGNLQIDPESKLKLITRKYTNFKW